jgi:iron-sulfur cluster insertion protein
MEEQLEQPQLVKMAPGAIAKIKELIAEENNPNLKLRMFVSGGGCSGMQYGFTFEEEVNEDDFDLEFDGVHVLVDSMSSQYLHGAEVDYTESLQGSQFSIKNPQAQTTCGCGSSFNPG